MFRTGWLLAYSLAAGLAYALGRTWFGADAEGEPDVWHIPPRAAEPLRAPAPPRKLDQYYEWHILDSIYVVMQHDCLMAPTHEQRFAYGWLNVAGDDLARLFDTAILELANPTRGRSAAASDVRQRIERVLPYWRVRPKNALFHTTLQMCREKHGPILGDPREEECYFEIHGDAADSDFYRRLSLQPPPKPSFFARRLANRIDARLSREAEPPWQPEPLVRVGAGYYTPDEKERIVRSVLMLTMAECGSYWSVELADAQHWQKFAGNDLPEFYAEAIGRIDDPNWGSWSDASLRSRLSLRFMNATSFARRHLPNFQLHAAINRCRDRYWHAAELWPWCERYYPERGDAADANWFRAAGYAATSTGNKRSVARKLAQEIDAHLTREAGPLP